MQRPTYNTKQNPCLFILHFGISLDIRTFNFTDDRHGSCLENVMRHQASGHKQNKSTRTPTASHKKQTSSRTPELLKYFVLASSSLFFVPTTPRPPQPRAGQAHKLIDKKVFASNLQTLMQVYFRFDSSRIFSVSYRAVFMF